MSKQSPTREAGTVHLHNLVSDKFDSGARFGLRMRLPAGDSFREILGEKWEKTRWFSTEAEREQAMRELRRQHPYYRLGDRPTLTLEKINRPVSGS